GDSRVDAETDRTGEVRARVGSEANEDAGPARHRGGQVGVAAGHLQVGRRRCGSSPRLARPDHAVGALTTLDAAMTPRRHAPAAARAVAAVTSSGTTSPIWCSRSIVCLTLRTKPPP